MFEKCTLRWYPPWIDVFGVKVRAGPLMGRLASRGWFRVVGPVRVKQPLAGGAVFHRVEAVISTRPSPAESPWDNWSASESYSFVLDSGVDFLVEDRGGRVRVAAADLEPIWPREPLRSLDGELAAEVLRRAIAVVPNVGDFAAPAIVGRELVIGPGDVVDVRGAHHVEIDPTGEAPSYREPPTRSVLRAPPEVPALIFPPRANRVR